MRGVGGKERGEHSYCRGMCRTNTISREEADFGEGGGRCAETGEIYLTIEIEEWWLSCTMKFSGGIFLLISRAEL